MNDHNENRKTSALNTIAFTVIGVAFSFFMLRNHRGLGRLDQDVASTYMIIFYLIFVPAFVAIRVSWKKTQNMRGSAVVGLLLGYISGLISYLIAMLIGGDLIAQLTGPINIDRFVSKVMFTLLIPLWIMSWYSGCVASLTASLLLLITERFGSGRQR